MYSSKFTPAKELFNGFQKTDEYKTLTKCQREFFKQFLTGGNVLLTGQAGTGKSHCINILVEWLGSKGIFVGKAALTGVAALVIGGSTIHSWAGMGLADEDVKSVVRHANKNKKAKARIRGTPILVVDEVSMASADIINKLDAVLKDVRFSHEPFGGITMIFSGDALQLPFIPKGRDDQLKFFFRAKSWEAANIATVELKEIKRQNGDSEFAKCLARLRVGDTSDLGVIKSRFGAKLSVEDPVRLFCKNFQVAAYNFERYSRIRAPEVLFTSQDIVPDPRYSDMFDRCCQASRFINLKVGARVRLLKNIDVEAGLVNGSVGTVSAFTSGSVVVDFDGIGKTLVETDKWEIKEQAPDYTGEMTYKVVATRLQIPLKLCWAESVHQCQGSTLDNAIVDLSEAFEFGQCYVALSRVKTIEGMSVVPFDFSRIKAHPDCLDFYAAKPKKKVKKKKEIDYGAKEGIL